MAYAMIQILKDVCFSNKDQIWTQSLAEPNIHLHVHLSKESQKCVDILLEVCSVRDIQLQMKGQELRSL